MEDGRERGRPRAESQESIKSPKEERSRIALGSNLLMNMEQKLTYFNNMIF
jgi:hypothetical protein